MIQHPDRLPEPETEGEAIALISAGLAWLYNAYNVGGDRKLRRKLASLARREADRNIVAVTPDGAEEVEP